MSSPTYNALAWTVDTLLSDIKLEAQIPNAEITDAEILSLASSCLWSDLVARRASDQSMGGRGISYEDTLASDFEGEESNLIWVPGRANADGIAYIEWYTNPGSSQARYLLQPTPVTGSQDYSFRDPGAQPSEYAFRSGRIAILPPPSTSSPGKVRVWYQQAHPELVETANVETVSSYSGSNGTYTVVLSGTPSGWPTADFAVDIYSAYAPHRHILLDSPATRSGGTLTLTLDDEHDSYTVPDGAYVSLAGQSGHVHLPLVYKRSMSAMVAARILRQQGHTNGANELIGDMGKSLSAAHDQYLPRTNAQSLKLIGRNTMLRKRGTRRGRRSS